MVGENIYKVDVSRINKEYFGKILLQQKYVSSFLQVFSSH